jgi:hypothetical protein
MKMKILKKTIVETNIGFPSEFKCKTTEEEEVLLSYRSGRVKVFVNDELKRTIDGPEGEFDVGGSCTIEEMCDVLVREEFLHDESGDSQESD